MPNFYTNSGYELIQDRTYQVLENEGHNEAVTKIFGYKRDRRRTFLFHFFAVLCLGVPYLLCAWFAKFKSIKFNLCNLSESELVFVSNTYGDSGFVPIEIDSRRIVNQQQYNNLRYFHYQHTKFIFDNNGDEFVPLDKFVQVPTLKDIVEYSGGLTQLEYINLFALYGPNTIEVEVDSYWNLFKNEVFSPFNVFQLFSIILWSCDNYYIYAICILLLTLFSMFTSLYQTRKQSESLHDLVNSSKCETTQVLRPNLIYGYTEHKVNATDLVPGDLLLLPASGCVMPCDAVLLAGACVVNESMLTGESVPVTKIPPNTSEEYFSSTAHKRHTLFCGTNVLQVRSYNGEHVLARVIKTGFDTTKGSLVKSILFPTPVGLKFYRDSFKFIFFLFVIAIFGMAYSVYFSIKRDDPISDIFVRMLDIVTIVVPPALPAAMTVGTVYSQNRLKKLGIFCISPTRINICGKIKLACFDKTGTLTNDGLQFSSVIPTTNAQFLQPVTNLQNLNVHGNFVRGMAVCHSLTQIDGKLIGDPLDLNLFECTDWELEEPESRMNTNFGMIVPTIVKPKGAENVVDDKNLINTVKVPYEIGIMRKFPFSSKQQCMSVICQVLGNPEMLVYTKGAPEKIQTLCNSETIPDDFQQKLAEITAQGYRVIALAYKALPNFDWSNSQAVKREIVECDLTFLGLISMQNALKPETAPVIYALHNANIRTVMITGDNVRTAVAVARECGMIKRQCEVVLVSSSTVVDKIPSVSFSYFDPECEMNSTGVNFANPNLHFAVDGKTWTVLRAQYQDLIPQLLVRGTVFARFNPDQKTQLVAQFQKLDYIVSMVGDGANDCGALKVAHVGVSLSQAEAGVAAPFTSSISNISCIQHLILEGRCALVTSFAVFKFMALYSLIQFISVLLLAKFHSKLGDTQFLFIDLIITTSLAVTIGRQGPSEKLVQKRPMGSLISLKNLIPLIFQVLLCGAIQIAAVIFLRQQLWFTPLPQSRNMITLCWTNTVVFLVSMFQYLILALVYSKGKPYRESRLRNYWFIFILFVLTCFIAFLIAKPIEPFDWFFEIMYDPNVVDGQKVFRYELLLLPFIHLILAGFIENAIADCAWFTKIIHFITWKQQPKNLFKRLLKESATNRLETYT